MAKKGAIYEEGGKFGISHVEDEAPKTYPFNTIEEAQTEATRIYNKATAVEESCAGGQPNYRHAAHLGPQ